MKPSQHVGTPGEKMELRLRLLTAREFVYEEYSRFLHRLCDEFGNVIVWWGSKLLHYADKPHEPGAQLNIGDMIEAEFKIKEHEAYAGENQTVVTHLRQVQTAEERKALRLYRKEQKREDLIAHGICPDCKNKGRLKNGEICSRCEGGW